MSFNVSASTVGMWIVNKQAPNPAGITDSPNAVRYVLSHDGCATQLPLVARFQSWQSALLRGTRSIAEAPVVGELVRHRRAP